MQAWQPHHRQPTETERLWLRLNLARVEMDVSAVLSSRLLTSELLALSAGDVVSLGMPVSRPIDVRVGATVKFKGRLTTVDGGERVGVWVDHWCDPMSQDA